jgi:hypothetical protein
LERIDIIFPGSANYSLAEKKIYVTGPQGAAALFA